MPNKLVEIYPKNVFSHVIYLQTVNEMKLAKLYLKKITKSQQSIIVNGLFLSTRLQRKWQRFAGGRFVGILWAIKSTLSLLGRKFSRKNNFMAGFFCLPVKWTRRRFDFFNWKLQFLFRNIISYCNASFPNNIYECLNLGARFFGLFTNKNLISLSVEWTFLFFDVFI